MHADKMLQSRSGSSAERPSTICLGGSGSTGLLANVVECRASAEPVELVNAHGVLGGHVVDLARGLGDLETDLGVRLALEKLLKTLSLDLVPGRDLRVVGLVRQPKGQDTLLLFTSA